MERVCLENDWLQKAAQQPLPFAQVREDPRLDLELVESLGHPVDALMICSGGCTAAALVASNLLSSVLLTDINSAQISLGKLKLDLMKDEGPVGRMRLLGHLEDSAESRMAWVNAWLLREQLPADIFGVPRVWAENGLDHCGRYELLFAELRNQMGANPRLLSPLQRETAFKSVMSQDNLVRLFGSEATANRLTEFCQHFHTQTERALAREESYENPFLTQMLEGRFRSQRYDWLDAEAPESWPTIEWKNQSMLETLKGEGSSSRDFVHLSNILDWLSPKKAQQTLAEATRVLRLGGLLVIRQLNSTLPIRDFKAGLTWEEALSSRLLAKDRSFFYRDLHVGRRVS